MTVIELPNEQAARRGRRGGYSEPHARNGATDATASVAPVISASVFVLIIRQLTNV